MAFDPEAVFEHLPGTVAYNWCSLRTLPFGPEVHVKDTLRVQYATIPTCTSPVMLGQFEISGVYPSTIALLGYITEDQCTDRGPGSIAADMQPQIEAVQHLGPADEPLSGPALDFVNSLPHSKSKQPCPTWMISDTFPAPQPGEVRYRSVERRILPGMNQRDNVNRMAPPQRLTDEQIAVMDIHDIIPYTHDAPEGATSSSWPTLDGQSDSERTSTLATHIGCINRYGRLEEVWAHGHLPDTAVPAFKGVTRGASRFSIVCEGYTVLGPDHRTPVLDADGQTMVKTRVTLFGMCEMGGDVPAFAIKLIYNFNDIVLYVQSMVRTCRRLEAALGRPAVPGDDFPEATARRQHLAAVTGVPLPPAATTAAADDDEDDGGRGRGHQPIIGPTHAVDLVPETMVGLMKGFRREEGLDTSPTTEPALASAAPSDGSGRPVCDVSRQSSFSEYLSVIDGHSQGQGRAPSDVEPVEATQ